MLMCESVSGRCGIKGDSCVSGLLLQALFRVIARRIQTARLGMRYSKTYVFQSASAILSDCNDLRDPRTESPASTLFDGRGDLGCMNEAYAMPSS